MTLTLTRCADMVTLTKKSTTEYSLRDKSPVIRELLFSREASLSAYHLYLLIEHHEILGVPIR